jgi:hypothetical protein
MDLDGFGVGQLCSISYRANMAQTPHKRHSKRQKIRIVAVGQAFEDSIARCTPNWQWRIEWKSTCSSHLDWLEQSTIFLWKTLFAKEDYRSTEGYRF